METTWLIFESGLSCPLTCSIYKAPKGSSRPVDAYVVTEHDGDFTLAARRAAEAVYALAVKRYSDIHPMVAGFDLSGKQSAGIQVSGLSGGLAFAIALAKAIFKVDPGPVAATGTVDANGCVGPVKGIAIKLAAAAEVLPENGWIIYPEANSKEITPDLEAGFSSKKLRVAAVSSIDDVVNLLLGDALQETKTLPNASVAPKFIMACLVFLLLAAAVAAYYYTLSAKKPEPSQASSEVEVIQKQIEKRDPPESESMQQPDKHQNITVESVKEPLREESEKKLNGEKTQDPSAEPLGKKNDRGFD